MATAPRPNAKPELVQPFWADRHSAASARHDAADARRHHGWRRGHASVPADQRSRQAGRAAGRKYRLVDIPISNCLNSGLRSIYVLTQFNSMSLHRHIQASYKFDNFSRSFIEILAAQQTPEGSQWYQGTADAVRQNMRYFLERPFDYYLILSGDQLYRMDFRALLQQHIQSGADITLATKPVHRSQVSEFGIMQSGDDRRITRFVEKPKDESLLKDLRMSPELLTKIGSGAEEELYQASMGIYRLQPRCAGPLFEQRSTSISASTSSRRRLRIGTSAPTFFKGIGRTSGPFALFTRRISSLTDLVPDYSFFDAEAPIYTHPRFLPGSKVNGATLAAGDHLGWLHHFRCPSGAKRHRHSQHHSKRAQPFGTASLWERIISSTIGNGTRVFPPLGIGRNCVIDRAIIDKNARIADGAVITPEGKPLNFDGDELFYPRRDRGGDQKWRDPRRHVDLSGG